LWEGVCGAVCITTLYVKSAWLGCWVFAPQEGGFGLMWEGFGMAWLLEGVALGCTLDCRVDFVGCR